MSTIVTRAGKGSALTHTEVDANFTNLNTDKIQSGNTVASLTVTSISGTTATYTNATISSADINGGTIDGTSIGSSSASTGAFTTLSASSTVSGTGFSNYLASPPAIGGSTPAAITGTTITANTAFSGPLNGSVGATTPAAGTFTSLTDSGNLTFTGTGNRITGDFTNATVANRVMFQTSTVNSSTAFGIIPNGTNSLSAFTAFNDSGATNSSIGQLRIDGTDVRVVSGIVGTGTYLPMTFYTGGSERMRVDTSGNVGIGTTSPSFKLDVTGNARVGNVYDTGLTIAVAGNSITYPADNTLAFNTNSAERARIDSSGNFQFNSGYGSVATAFGCRAWVNFNGTGTPAIRASGNVSSITDITTGRYRINLTTAMPDVNYAVLGFCQPTVSNNGSDTFSNINDNTTSVVDFVHYEDGVNRDSNFVSVAIFR
jgi:hypothetical protein